MTPAQLAAIRARAEAATPAPWKAQPYVGDPGRAKEYGITGPMEVDCCPTIVTGDGFLFTEKDAKFVARARTDIPARIAEVERLQVLEQRAAEYAGRLCNTSVGKLEAEVERLTALCAEAAKMLREVEWRRAARRQRRYPSCGQRPVFLRVDVARGRQRWSHPLLSASRTIRAKALRSFRCGRAPETTLGSSMRFAFLIAGPSIRSVNS